MHRSGTSLVARILAEADIKPPLDLLPAHPVDNPGGYFESREVVRINNSFLVALGRSWSKPEPLSEHCFASSEATHARAEIRAFLGQCKPGNGSLLLKDPRFCRLLPLWLPELKSHFELLVVVHVLRRADAVFRSLARRAENQDTTQAAVTCASQSDLLWLHYNLELNRYARHGQYLVIAYEDLLSDPETVAHALIVELGQLLLSKLRLPSSLSVRVVPAVNGKLFSDRDRVLETVYQNLRSSADDNMPYLEAAWEHLQVRVPDAHQDQVEATDAGLFHQARLQHFMNKCEYRPAFPKPSPIRFLANKLRWSIPLVNNAGSQVRPILFISGNPASRSHLYRVKNAVEELHRLDTPACWMTVDMLKRHSVEQINARCVIIHRCVYDPTIEQLLDWCKRQGIPVGFDIDDLIFDAELIRGNSIHFINELPPSEQHKWIQSALSYHRVMETVDFCLVPTPTLADHARRINPQVYVIENGFNAQVQALSDFWRFRRSAGSVVRIGYASGTATHAADFSTVVHPVAEALQRHPESLFTIVGNLDLRPYSGLLPSGQVETRPLVEHVNLAYELARFDINLVPLQAGNAFCDSKSPLKYFEAALAGAPTIAVNNPIYSELIRNGENGMLARSEEEWFANIELLMSDQRAQEHQSSLARKECIARFYAAHLAEKYLHLPI